MLHKDLLERLCRARSVLGAASGFRLPVKAVAASAGMSVFHFSRVFRAVFGQSPNQNRLEARFRFAQGSLAFGTMPVTEIALAAGFASPGCLTLMARLPRLSTI